MTLRQIPDGTVVGMTYLAIPTQVGTVGPRFPNTDDGWDHAVEHCHGLIANASTPIAADAMRRTLVIALRWVLDTPDGSSTDTEIERHNAAECRKTIRR